MRTRNRASLNRSQISEVVILKRFCLLYFLKTVDLISAKLPLMIRLRRAWSEEFMATFSVAT